MKRSRMHSQRLKLWWLCSDSLLPLLPWLLALCSNAAANKCTSSIIHLQAPTCELITSAKASSLVIPAAIPLMPIVTKPEVDTKPQNSKRTDKGSRRADKVRLNEIYEGSFNFAHPSYQWMDDKYYFGVHSGDKLNAKGMGNRLEHVQSIDLSPASYASWSKTRRTIRHLSPSERKHGVTKPGENDEDNQTIVYVGTLLCGPLLFFVLAFGLCTRLSRSPSEGHLANDESVEGDGGGSENGSNDHAQAPHTSWRTLLQALLRSGMMYESLTDCLSPEEIQKIPLVSHCEADHGHSGTKFRCIICLNDVKDGELLREIPGCRHRFHPTCVDAWLARSATCPLCRQHVIVDGEQETTGSENENGAASEASPGPSGSNLMDRDPLSLVRYIRVRGTFTAPLSSAEDDEPVTPCVEGPGIAGIDREGELPNSFAARSIDSESWSETSDVNLDEWELLESGT